MSNIDRRAFFRRLGLGVVALGPVGSLAGFVASNRTSPAGGETSLVDAITSLEHTACPGIETSKLLGPLGPGSQLGGATLNKIKAYPHYVSLELTSERGDAFRVEICGRDDGLGAPKPVTRTDRFDVFVANGGKGDKWTSRHHGVTAFAVADVLARNEREAGSAGLRTLRDRNVWA